MNICTTLIIFLLTQTIVAGPLLWSFLSFISCLVMVHLQNALICGENAPLPAVSFFYIPPTLQFLIFYIAPG